MPYISLNQHGFLPGKSCVSNLLECLDVVNGILADQDSADIMYLDFQKAFDSVPHHRLLAKLESYGIKGKTLETIKDFLSNRTFNVKVGAALSKSFPVSSGVPQGSVLGPLLFLIYINDLPDGLKSFVSLFADDVKMVTRSSNYQIAQQDLDLLSEWESKWLINFNVQDGKCKVLHVGPKNPAHQYSLNNLALPTVDNEKDLGVYTTSCLSWAHHVEKITNKARSVCGWISRNVISREASVMLAIYKSLVRPHLEYAVQVWNPTATHGNWQTILELENVQRSFTRMIDNIGLLRYNERLKELGLTTLLERRARGDLIETFKILSGNVKYGRSLFKTSRSGVNVLKDKRSNEFFTNRVANYWNKLPEKVTSANTVLTFKARLEAFKIESTMKNTGYGNYWELSNEIFNRINDSNHDSYVNFMLTNPAIAKLKKINTNIFS